MSVEPPSSGRPTGPPSGPLSGPSQPPSGPPAPPPSGSGAGAPSPEPHHPWWKSVPRIAVLSTVVVAAVILAVVLSRGGGGTGDTVGGEVFLQSAGSTGPDPFTESTATDRSGPDITPTPATESATPSNTVRGVDGGAAGLYSGKRNVASCDVEKQVQNFQAAPEKNRAFATVARVEPSDVPAYLRSLTPVQLRMDTRVTNHGYRDGAANGFQAVLQSSTAVLVDAHGVPRLRCACGNPLTSPIARQGTLKQTGDSWPSYRSSNVVVVMPSTKIVNEFVIYDHDRDEWIARHRGDETDKDKKTKRPPKPSPSVSVSTPTAPSSPTSTAPSTPSSKDEPSKDKPSKDESTKDESTKDEPSKDEPSKDEPTTDEPTTDEPTTDEPTTDEPTTDEPTTQPESPGTITSSQPPPDEETTTESQSGSVDTRTSSPSL